MLSASADPAASKYVIGSMTREQEGRQNDSGKWNSMCHYGRARCYGYAILKNQEVGGMEEGQTESN